MHPSLTISIYDIQTKIVCIQVQKISCFLPQQGSHAQSRLIPPCKQNEPPTKHYQLSITLV